LIKEIIISPWELIINSAENNPPTMLFLFFLLQMCDRIKIKLQQTTHALGVLAYNQRLLIDNTAEDGEFRREFICRDIIRLIL